MEPAVPLQEIRRVQLGRYELDCWYKAPYPEGYAQEKLYICEHCLKYYKEPGSLGRCCQNPQQQHPPGDVIYCDGQIRVFEVDGEQQKLYAQCLCLLSKLFLDHASMAYSVSLFRFYVFAEIDAQDGSHIVGDFSVEKAECSTTNLSCILTLPPYQRQRLGQFFIALSYALSKVDGRIGGGPERPLSDLGELAYRLGHVCATA